MGINPYFSWDFFTGRKKNDEDTEVESPFRGSVTGGTEPSYDGRDAKSYLDEVRNSYLRETDTQSAYREHMMNPPQQERVGWRRRLGAAALGGLTGYAQGPLAGIQTAEQVNQSPYRRQVEDWQRQGQGMKAAVDAEDDQAQRRLGYMREVRGVYHDEAQIAQQMRQYDLAVARDRSNDTYRNATLAHTIDRDREVNEDRDAARADANTRFHGIQATTRRGQDLSSTTARRGQDLSRQSAKERNERPLGTNRSPSLEADRDNRRVVREVLADNPDWADLINNEGIPYAAANQRPQDYKLLLDEINRRKRRKTKSPGDINLDADPDEVDFEVR